MKLKKRTYYKTVVMTKDGWVDVEPSMKVKVISPPIVPDTLTIAASVQAHFARCAQKVD